MTTSGWIMMGVSLSIVWIGTIVCYKLILSSDKDLMQLVSPHVVLHHALRDEIMDEKAVQEYFGVPPERVADVLASWPKGA